MRSSALGLFCPITSQAKGYPFEVAIPEGLPVSGVVLADQVKRLDWRTRQAKFAARLPAKIGAESWASSRSCSKAENGGVA